MTAGLNDFTITSLETISAFSLSGDFLFTLDELQEASISQSQETADITGKQGRKLSTLKKNKAVKISGKNGLVSAGLMELQTGSGWETGTHTVKWTDFLTVSSDTAGTTYTALGDEGEELGEVYIRNCDCTLGTRLTQASEASEGCFSYDPDTKTITFSSGELSDGTEIAVFYSREITGSAQENLSSDYSSKCALYIDAFAEDKCSNVYRVQFYIPKADFSGDFSFDMGDSQTVHSFEAESLAGCCCSGGGLWTCTVFAD